MTDVTEHYATLFDSAFLPQGLALLASLDRHHRRSFVLHVLCMDLPAHDALIALGRPTIRPIPISTLMTDELRHAWNDRTASERCWTTTPSLLAHVLKDRKIGRVTYVDADMWFFGDPDRLFEEFESSGKAVQITLHGYLPDYDISFRAGRFCVQFLTVGQDGRPVLERWRRECLEWCYARFELGRFGDQKYLDSWPHDFPELVHILTRSELVLAPWNCERFPLSEAVAFHFHGLRLLRNNRVLAFRGYSIPLSLQNDLYPTYLKDLAAAVVELGKHGFPVATQARSPGVFATLGILWRKFQRAWARMRPYRVLSLPVSETES